MRLVASFALPPVIIFYNYPCFSTHSASLDRDARTKVSDLPCGLESELRRRFDLNVVRRTFSRCFGHMLRVRVQGYYSHSVLPQDFEKNVKKIFLFLTGDMVLIQ